MFVEWDCDFQEKHWYELQNILISSSLIFEDFRSPRFKMMDCRYYLEQAVVPIAAATTCCLSLQVAQVAGRFCRVSCVTPGWSSVLGCIAVSSSSLAAGQVSFAIQRYLAQGPGTPEKFVISRNDAVFCVITGLAAFKIFGGHFCNLMPSHVCHKGALANFSMPARGPNLASPVQIKNIRTAFLVDGCHHCGRRSGKSIADHIPPNMIVETIKQKRNQGFWAKLLNVKQTRTPQRFYPQCEKCMKRQSAFLINGKNPFVFHWKRGIPKPSHLSSLLLGSFTYKGNSSTNEGKRK
ncbi:hypothetical protein KP509_22G064300 [Ceratopteris richardii]|uniref:Uncharacterized protein n=1 Tax=Ceratopteris richardii TaxID=49495 RepID=A0A8T2S933_CERRI|nr:hypothetical protein KP509_22G064300 [Ceratopteris richardii]